MSDFKGLSEQSLRDRKNYFSAKLAELIERRRKYEARLSSIKSDLECQKDYLLKKQLQKERDYIVSMIPEVERATIETNSDIKELNILISQFRQKMPESNIMPKLQSMLEWLREVNRTETREAVREFSMAVTKRLSGVIKE